MPFPFNPYRAVLRIRKVEISGVILLLLVTITLLLTNEWNPVKTTKPALGYAEKQDKISEDQERIEQRQIERQKNLKDYCGRHVGNSKQGETVSRELLGHLIVNDKYKVIYCYIPKVACSQWKRVFLDLENRANVRDVHSKSNFKFLQKYSDEGVKIRLQSYYKFLFVREPFERLLSAYENKFVKRQWPWRYIWKFEKAIYNKFSDVDPSVGWNVTFKRFVYFLNDFGFNLDEHWAPYGRLCFPCDIEYDFIGHFKDMPEEAAYVLKKTGMDKEVIFPEFVTHNTTDKLLQKYAPVPREKIVELGHTFKEDFEMFNYNFPGPLSSLMED